MTDAEIDNLIVFVLGHGLSNASREAVKAAVIRAAVKAALDAAQVPATGPQPMGDPIE